MKTACTQSRSVSRPCGLPRRHHRSPVCATTAGAALFTRALALFRASNIEEWLRCSAFTSPPWGLRRGEYLRCSGLTARATLRRCRMSSMLAADPSRTPGGYGALGRRSRTGRSAPALTKLNHCVVKDRNSLSPSCAPLRWYCVLSRTEKRGRFSLRTATSLPLR